MILCFHVVIGKEYVMEIKCTCGKKECPLKMRISAEGVDFTDKKGNSHFMYVDANALVRISIACQRAIKRKCQDEEC